MIAQAGPMLGILVWGDWAAGLPCCVVPAALLLVAGLLVVGMYNSLVRGRNHVRESWAGIDTELRAAASTGSPARQAADENLLVGALRQLFALRESYPELKASENFLALQHQLAETEDRIQAVRRFYNANVRDYNNRCEMLPTNVLARMFRFEQAEFFEIETAVERQVPPVNLRPMEGPDVA